MFSIEGVPKKKMTNGIQLQPRCKGSITSGQHPLGLENVVEIFITLSLENIFRLFLTNTKQDQAVPKFSPSLLDFGDDF